MPNPTVLPPVPPPPFNKWVILATAISFVAMIGMFFLQTDPEEIAPDGPLGQTAEPIETPEEPAPTPAEELRSEAPPYTGSGSLAGSYLAGRHAQAIREMGDAASFLGKAQSKSLEATDLPRRIFLLTLSEGNMKEAVPLAGDVLKINPTAAIAGLVVIVEDLFQAHYPEARKKIQSLPSGGLNVYMTPLLDTWTSMALGEATPDVLARLKPLEKDGSEALYKLHSALINDVAGNTEQAEKDYLAAIDKQGGPSLRLVELLGNLYERSGQGDMAKELYEGHIKTNPRSPLARHGLRRLKSGAVPKPVVGTALDGAAESFFGIATSLSQQNARETAQVFGRMALYLRADFPVMQMLLGNILQADLRYEDANMVFAAIDKDSPYSWPTRLSMADNLDDLDRTDEAEKHLRAMAAEEPDLPEPLIRLGDMLRGREQFAKAVDIYNQAFERIGEPQPHHWSLLYARGIVLERSDQWEKAEPDFLKALEFKPDQPMILNYLGYSWVDKGIHLERATKMIRKAVDLLPTDGYISDSLGWAHYRMGNFKESTKELERAVGLRPEDPVINDHLGDAYWRVGRTNEARFQWQRVLTLDPDDKLAGEVAEKLKNGLKPIDKTN